MSLEDYIANKIHWPYTAEVLAEDIHIPVSFRAVSIEVGITHYPFGPFDFSFPPVCRHSLPEVSLYQIDLNILDWIPKAFSPFLLT